MQPGSVESPVPCITDVEQHWDRLILGRVTFQRTCLKMYSVVWDCLLLWQLKDPLGPVERGRAIVFQTWVSILTHKCLMTKDSGNHHRPLLFSLLFAVHASTIFVVIVTTGAIIGHFYQSSGLAMDKGLAPEDSDYTPLCTYQEESDADGDCKL